jgi:hypothetical protein
MTVRILVDDQVLELNDGTILATALATALVTAAAAAPARHGASEVGGTRRSVSGEWRGPFCGMGTCFECRVTIDGVRHQRSCQIVVRDGMEVRREG